MDGKLIPFRVFARAAIAECKKIINEWSFTQKERRRIDKAREQGQFGKYPYPDNEVTHD